MSIRTLGTILDKNDLFFNCDTALNATVGDPSRAIILEQLTKSVSDMEKFVRGYERINDPSIDTDDEILNWAFSEAHTDFNSAIWLLSSGFYKASASSLRNAIDIATASLYFQIRENTEPEAGGYNRFFAEWDRGDRDTPNWGEMKPFISKQPSVARFSSKNGFDVIELAYGHFKHLCSYTHTSAFTKNGNPVTAINMTGVAPVFDATCFSRGHEMTTKTLSNIAMLWQVTFPQIMDTLPLGEISSGSYDVLFPGKVGKQILNHK